MIDRKAMQRELHHARMALLDAQAANSDVEELIWELRHVQVGHQRIVFSIASLEQEPAGVTS